MASSTGSPSPEDFDRQGKTFLGYFRRYAGLESHHRVLDVGCGSGRIARGLTTFLDARGSYEGFDLLDKPIAWCAANITPLFGNFRFRHFDIANSTYNPRGTIPPEAFTFPFRDGEFDLVVMTSVFTHMLPGSLEAFLGEVRRVMKPGGRCLITFFLLNDVQAILKRNGAPAAFSFSGAGILSLYAVENEKRPEDAVAYDEGAIRSLYRRHGLAIVEPILFGSWSGRARPVSFQDMVIATVA